MAGLKEEYREAVILSRPQKDSTLPNATMIAQLYQDSKIQQGELYELKRELRSLKYKNDKLEKENSKLIRNKHVEKQQKTVTCHYCGKIGLIVSECRKKQNENRTNHRNFVNICSQEIFSSSFNSINTSVELSMSSCDESFVSYDESFDSYAASSSGYDSLTDQSWLDESICTANEHEFSSHPLIEMCYSRNHKFRGKYLH